MRDRMESSKHCSLCGDETDSALELETGVCTPCAEVPLYVQ